MDRPSDQGRAHLTAESAVESPADARSRRGQNLGNLLFHEAAPTGRRARVLDRWGVGAFAALGMAVLLLWRSAPSLADFMWAEDGAVFLRDAGSHSLSSVLLQPYNGYAHVVPRLVAAVAALPPVSTWAVGIAVLSAAVRVAVAVFAWYATAGAIPSRVARYVVAVVVVTLPAGSLEVLNSAANLHWFLLYGAVVAAVWTPCSIVGTAVQCLVIALAVLSDPVALGVAPLLIARIALRRRGAEFALVGSFVVAAAVQLSIVLQNGRAIQAGNTVLDIVQIYAIRVGLLSATGPALAARHHGLRSIALALGLLVLVLVIGLVWGARTRALIVVCLVGSVGLYFAAMLYMPLDPLMMPDSGLAGFDPGYALRYGVAPMLLLLTAAVGACASALRAAPAVVAIAATATVGLVVVYVAGFVLTFRDPATTTQTPWRSQVTDAVAECRAGADNGVLTVEPFAARVDLPCPVLLDRG